MWITADVQLPDELVDAQKAGTLVVFAGAGVSMGAPSNLPSFEELAEKVARGLLTRGEHEPVDRFLGRLYDRAVKVHKRAADIIGDAASQHTPLHVSLLSLFESAATARLVTTNFDRHFTTASRTAYTETPETHYAPALLLGRSFTWCPKRTSQSRVELRPGT